MPGPQPHPRLPKALLVDHEDWSTDSLERVLTPAGYSVSRVRTGVTGMERARTQPPDVTFINIGLPDMNGVDLCRDLRDEPRFGPTIPIIAMSTRQPELRMAALEAGAWDVLRYPFNARELLGRLETYTASKFEADRIRGQMLIDQPTGLYSMRGLERRAQELQALAYRQHQPLACVVLAPSFSANGDLPSSGTDVETLESVVLQLAKALRAAGRASDALGRLGTTEFAIIAPMTDAQGAVKLIVRLADAIRSANGQTVDRPGFQLRAGYEAIADAHETPIEAHDLLERAAIALRKARSADNGGWIQPFENRALGLANNPP